MLTCHLTLHSFSNVVSRLFELGVPTEQFVTAEPWIIPTVDEQKAAKKD
jgi:cytochrome c peroxidase